MSADVVMFDHSGARTAPPSCGANLPVRWAISSTGHNGQAKLATILTAYSARKRIEIAGVRLCQDWGDTASVDYLVVID